MKKGRGFPLPPVSLVMIIISESLATIIQLG